MRAWAVSCGCCISSSVRLVVTISGFRLRYLQNRKWQFRFDAILNESTPIFIEQIFLQENLLIRYQRKRVASAILCGISGLGEAQQVFWSWICKKSGSKLARWYRLALLAAIANSKTSWAKNNRPHQVKLENGWSWSQNDFQIWKAPWEAS